MFDQQLIEYCAPTLASIKTASLFSVNIEEMVQNSSFNIWEHELNKKGVSMTVLHTSHRRTQIYVYRREMLERDIRQERVANFLKECGYECQSVAGDINHLKQRMDNCKQFPHEIGLFLGYPIDDVIGFIENGGKNSICCGYWKVYYNRQEAEKQFMSFNRCRNIYKHLFKKGKTISQLTVAV